MKLHKNISVVSIFLLLFIQAGCKKFLDQKPDLSMVVPTSLSDCQAVLDQYSRMNASYPDHGEAAADNYYLTDATWNGFAAGSENSNNYIWAPIGEHVSQWANCYNVVYSSNLVLQVLEKFSAADQNYNAIKGSALFFRAFAHYNAAQLFAKPYTAATAGTDMGVPFRLSPDVDVKSERGTVQQTYNHIVQDLTEALDLLPITVTVKSRPSKAAAYAALARVYLDMEDYINAGKMADECLKLQSTLIDYNATSPTATSTTVGSNVTGASFQRFHAEIIFQAVTSPGTLTQTQAFIDPSLYNSYSITDRRKVVFFQSPAIGTYVFRGSYDGSTSASLFNGFATDEVYLIRAECAARATNTTAAMADLNTLLSKRMVPPYVNRTALNADDALSQILSERRKELIFRTLRWTDLRRLNKDSRFAKSLTRPMNTMVYDPLQPNDLRYVMLIPTKEVITLTGMPQNPR